MDNRTKSWNIISCVAVLAFCLITISAPFVFALSNKRDDNGKCHLVSTNIGLQAQLPVLINDTAYEIKRFNDGTGILFFYDYANELSGPFSVKSDGSESSGPIIFTDCVGSISPIDVNGSLFVVKCGHPADSYGYPGASSYFGRIDLDSGAVQIEAFKSNECVIEDTALAADNEFIYCMTYTVNVSNDEVTAVYLTRVDLDTLKPEHIIRFSPTEGIRISGTYDNGLALLKTVLPNDYSGTTMDEMISSLTHSILLLDTSSNRLSETGISWINGELTCAISNGSLYYVNNNESTLYRTDLLSAETTMITSDLLLNAHTDGAKVYLTGNCFHECIEYHIVDSNEVVICLYSIEKGLAVENTLTYEYLYDIYNICVLDIEGEYCLVNCGINEVPVEDIADDGTVYEGVRLDYIYGLIDFNSYWESNEEAINKM